MSELVARKEVRVEFQKRDRYGRIVGKVWVTPPDCPTCGKTLDVGCCIVFEIKDGQIFDGREHFFDVYAWDEFWS